MDEDWLLDGDAIAAELLGELEPLAFREARGDAEREEAFRLRHRAVLEMPLSGSAREPEGLERDEFDASAVQILGWDGDRAIATCRLVLPQPGRPLPAEAAFDLRLPGADCLVEWGRVVVDPAYRGDGHSVLLGLTARGWTSLRSRGFTGAIGATPKRLVGLLDALGFAVTVLGPPRIYWGEERYPILCEGRPTVPRLRSGVLRSSPEGEACPPPEFPR